MTKIVSKVKKTLDGNEACAYVAYKCNDIVAIYPITPSSPMAEYADAWAAEKRPNLWGSIPLIQEMQSEAGAAGALHGSLQAGALTSSFTASQGLLLMIPNMFKVAGELTSAVLHVSARSVASHGLSIFCDHSDVMATRSTGWAMLFANSVQEAHDFALISQASTLKTRVPFLHIFDGFRTSHEISKIELLEDRQMQALLDEKSVREHRMRALSPENPVLRGTAQNPDVFFQSRERANKFYEETPSIVAQTMEDFYQVTGRRYRLFDYAGANDAERIIVIMGSGAETAEQVTNTLLKQGEKVGLLKVRLFRPFDTMSFLNALPESVKSIAVLDRTKEAGSQGEPLLQDIITAVYKNKRHIEVIGGRYGLGSKEFTPGMVKAVFDELKKDSPKARFTVGIKDDLSGLSLDYDQNYNIESESTVQAIFWGLGSDGTVGANKNSIKIIGEETENHAQGYFVYDSKKSGSVTVSHLRFGPDEIHAPYLIRKANFIAVHQFQFTNRYPLLEAAEQGASILLNSPHTPENVLAHLPEAFISTLREKKLRLFVLDAIALAKELGLGGRINTIMQAGFFALSGVLPQEEALEQIKKAIKKTYGKFGEPVLRKNCAAVDAALDHLHEVKLEPIKQSGCSSASSSVSQSCNSHDCSGSCPAASFAQISHESIMEMIAGRGDNLPVSAMPPDGTFPTNTAKFEKRDIAQEIPVWDPSCCIQCGKCVFVCPHAVIRSKLAEKDAYSNAPENFKTQKSSWRDEPDKLFTIQVSAEDCTGCSLCVEICPAKNKSQVGRKAINMEPRLSINREAARADWEFFLNLPSYDEVRCRSGCSGNGVSEKLHFTSVKNVQLLDPLFEFSGACAGCGETPYVKLMSQLFGQRAMIANATGCSSIYGGNLPTTPWSTNKAGKGPAWSNSLFEDNAEFGLGMSLAVEIKSTHAMRLLEELKEIIGIPLVEKILENYESSAENPQVQRELISQLKEKLAKLGGSKELDLISLADFLVKRSIWIIGGDGWAYDIGYGGLDHVLASGKNVNILVLDTEVYSNTGGQMSKSTARGAVAKFAAGGKTNAKKDLGMLAMSYGNVYVAKVAMGANDSHCLKAFIQAESYPGTSLIIAYSHCIAHGINMQKGMHQQKLAVNSGHWPLYRFDPRLKEKGENPFELDSNPPCIPLEEYYYSETRYRMLKQSNPAEAALLLEQAKDDIKSQWQALQRLKAAGESERQNEDAAQQAVLKAEMKTENDDAKKEPANG